MNVFKQAVKKGRHPLKNTRKYPRLFRFIRNLVRICYPKLEIVGLENLPDDPCAIIGNHAQLHGPIAGELYLPECCYTWCAAQMMEFKEVPAYAYMDFWSQKPKWQRPFFRVCSYIIAPLSVLIFNNARTIAVHRDYRILTTFRESIATLQRGNSLVIFPEQDKPHNHIVAEFQDGFTDVAKLYYKRTGKCLSFVPMYIAPKLKKLYLGKPTAFSPDAPIAEERRRICAYLMDEITAMAEALPCHTVVPYRNIPKRLYPKNIRKEAKS